MFLRNPGAFLVAMPAILVAITFHEFAHGKMASILGDPTPKATGRLSLNPLRHLDVYGTLMLLIVGFGWAKPVQVNPMYFKDRRKGMILTSLAGPVMNLVLAYFAALIWPFSGANGWLGDFFFYLIWFNVVLGVFNLIPIPPLDGSKVLFGLLPNKWVVKLAPLQQYGNIALILLLLSGMLGRIMTPAIMAIMRGLDFMVGLIA
jgi:Zn-dependent protease